MANEVPAIIVISHGPFCEGLVESTKMIFGPTERLEALPLHEGESPEEYQKDFCALLDKYNGNVFICVDVFGGTPFNTLMKVATERKLCAIVGINMPMLIELLSSRDTLSGNDLAKAAVEANSVVDANLCPMLDQMYSIEKGF